MYTSHKPAQNPTRNFQQIIRDFNDSEESLPQRPQTPFYGQKTSAAWAPEHTDAFTAGNTGYAMHDMSSQARKYHPLYEDVSYPAATFANKPRTGRSSAATSERNLVDNVSLADSYYGNGSIAGIERGFANNTESVATRPNFWARRTTKQKIGIVIGALLVGAGFAAGAGVTATKLTNKGHGSSSNQPTGGGFLKPGNYDVTCLLPATSKGCSDLEISSSTLHDTFNLAKSGNGFVLKDSEGNSLDPITLDGDAGNPSFYGNSDIFGLSNSVPVKATANGQAVAVSYGSIGFGDNNTFIAGFNTQAPGSSSYCFQLHCQNGSSWTYTGA